MKRTLALLSANLLLWVTQIFAQGTAIPAVPGPDSLTITLANALSRAQSYSTQLQTANIAVQLAHQDRVQARAAALPSASAFNQFIYTEGNGTPSGVFVANDGVHVYNEQLQAHEELLALIRRGEIKVAAVAETVAQARADVTARGLKAAVIASYYAVAAAQRRLTNAQQSLSEARQFLDITQKQESGGEVAHSDVIKAQLPVLQRQRDSQDAQLAAAKAKIALAVLIFPNLQINYSVVDDLAQLPLLPPLSEATAAATVTNPDVRAARLTLNQARLGVNVARYAFLPSLGLDVFYGFNANQFAFRTNYPTQATGRSTLPNYLVPFRQNLGYSAQATLTVPIWNWGSIQSRVKQAALRRQQAELDLTLTRKQLDANLASYYQEAQTALSQIESLRTSSDLSAESLRLTTLRYQAGEATALEVVDAQNTANLARSAYNDGLVRYRVALATLQTLTGSQP